MELCFKIINLTDTIIPRSLTAYFFTLAFYKKPTDVSYWYTYRHVFSEFNRFQIVLS